MRKCIDECCGARFQGRELRIKKAVEPYRLEKKKRRTEERKENKIVQRAEKKVQDQEDDDELDRLRNFEKSAYGTGDAEKSSKAPGISDASKKIKKDKAKSFEDHFGKIHGKHAKRSEGDFGEIDITNRLAHNKEKTQLIYKQKIDNETSKFENLRNNITFKDQLTMKQGLKTRIEKTRKLHMKKINTIKVKKSIN